MRGRQNILSYRVSLSNTPSYMLISDFLHCLERPLQNKNIHNVLNQLFFPIMNFQDKSEERFHLNGTKITNLPFSKLNSINENGNKSKQFNNVFGCSDNVRELQIKTYKAVLEQYLELEEPLMQGIVRIAAN